MYFQDVNMSRERARKLHNTPILPSVLADGSKEVNLGGYITPSISKKFFACRSSTTSTGEPDCAYSLKQYHKLK